MKKIVIRKTLAISLLAVGISTYGYWQLGIKGERGGGVTPTAALPQWPVRLDDSSAAVNVHESKSDQLPDVVATSLPANTQQSSLASDSSNAQPVAENVIDVIVEENPDSKLADFFASGKPEKIKQYYAERRRQRAALVQGQMDEEYPDPEWSAELSQRFEFASSLVPGLPTMSLSQVDCRETICALHVGIGDSGYKTIAPFMDHIGTVLGSDTWVHHDATPSGAVIYVAEVDMQLPDLEQ